jgi:tryptophan synthase beta chain
LNAPSRPNDYTAYPDARGRFGDYGGRYVPETLMPLVHDLDAAYAAAKADAAFQAELAAT